MDHHPNGSPSPLARRAVTSFAVAAVAVACGSGHEPGSRGETAGAPVSGANTFGANGGTPAQAGSGGRSGTSMAGGADASAGAGGSETTPNGSGGMPSGAGHGGTLATAGTSPGGAGRGASSSGAGAGGANASAGAGANLGGNAGLSSTGGGMTGASGNAGAAGARVLAADSLAVRFADAVIARAPDPLDITSSTGFEYNHGIVLRGIEQVYRYTHAKKYADYIQKYVDDFVDAQGNVSIASGYSLDNIEPAVLLPFLYAETGLSQYATAAAQVRALYDGFPRNDAGGFWHKQSYPNQMWLDSIYMGEPFLAEYGAVIGTCGSFCADTVVEQMSLVAEHLQNENTGLLLHAWDDSSGTKASWADPTTGASPEVWGRALGWYAMSLVDNLPDLPDATSGKSELLAVLAKLAAGIEKYQDASTGLWYQVVDKGSMSDDFLETSGSGMFVYALSAGVTRGLIDTHYADVAAKGFAGLQTKVTTDTQGRPSITGAVHGMGVQNDYASYVNQLPLLTDSPHGLCAILLAASEMEAHAP
jgi:unsaturated rhamnogalacturonyl hydrolase